jgi:hypothetical protein
MTYLITILARYLYRFAASRCEEAGAAIAEEGTLVGHLLVAEEIRPSHVIHHDGAS